MRKVLIIGVAGFLGSNLLKSQLQKGNTVIGVDNLITGFFRNIATEESNPNFRFFEADFLDWITSNDFEVDEIYHLASPASPPKYLEYPRETMRANTIGTELLCEYALNHGARLVFASTSEIYGDPLVHPQVEEYWGNVSTLGPRSVYDESKRFGETVIAYFNRTYNVDLGIVRIFNTYGPNMDPYDGRVVSTFLRQLINNEEVTMFGDGSQTRSFCYVSDLIEGLERFMKSGKFGPINLGNPAEFSLIELLSEIEKIVGKKANLVWKELPIHDPRRRKPDISKAKTELKWQPNISLKEGLEMTHSWMQKSFSV